MAEYLIQEETLTDIADAIRTKTGSTDTLTPEEMASTLNNIPNRSSSNLTANGATVTVPAGHYASQATKNVATVTRASTTISTTPDDTNDTLTITASNDQGTGYVTGSNQTASKTITLTASGATVTASDGSNSVSKSVQSGSVSVSKPQVLSGGTMSVYYSATAGYIDEIPLTRSTNRLNTQAATTITPSTSDQTAVAKGVYTTGAITVAGDSNLIASNIKSGVSIFDVTGSYSGDKLVLFSANDQHTDITGGWTKRGSGSGTVSIGKNISVNCNGHRKFAYVSTVNKIDLTSYNKLIFFFDDIYGESSDGSFFGYSTWGHVGIVSDGFSFTWYDEGTWDGELEMTKSSRISMKVYSRSAIIVDISEISGSYYPCLSLLTLTEGWAHISEVRLE